MKSADLHLHTIFSDGTDTPGELINKVTAAGLSCFSVVDHDTVAGVGPCLDLASARGLELIPGIELSAEYDGKEVHILGYLVDFRNRDFLEKLASIREYRVRRVQMIIDKLKPQGIELDPRSVFELAGNASVGRMHVARAMVKDGLVGNIYEAFQKYIGDKCPAYVAGFQLSVKEAARLIRGVSGVPVLAHPYSLHNDDLIGEFAAIGIMGLEIHYPEHSQSLVNFYLDLAKRYGLLVTGGSDYHGDAKPDVKVGAIKIDYTLVEELKKAGNNL
ncbi:MAG: PHP domain-containing protein [Candidatus Omnitrophica bacterium]|nr:PHP domain-containing protein [Candidatus Omnitrophota bacterium]